MKLILFTKDMKEYKPFIDMCKLHTTELLIVFPKDHPLQSKNKYFEFKKKCEIFSPDLIISFYYNRIIHDDILTIADLSVNFHNALLPNYAGAHPINWQIINGEKTSGVTIHELTSIVDGGRIICQKDFKINFNDTAYDVLIRGINVSSTMLPKLLKDYKNNSIIKNIQVKTGNEYSCRRRYPRDGEITKNMNQLQIYNKIRALAKPWPGAFYYNKKNQKIIFDNYVSYDECKTILERIKNEDS